MYVIIINYLFALLDSLGTCGVLITLACVIVIILIAFQFGAQTLRNSIGTNVVAFQGLSQNQTINLTLCDNESFY